MSDEGVRALIAALPDTVRVGPYDFRIERMDAMTAECRRLFGEMSAMRQVISIQADRASRIAVLDTFLHELLHAIFWVHRIEDEDKEERIVGVLGRAWAQVHRDNPWLVEWIAKAVAPA